MVALGYKLCSEERTTNSNPASSAANASSSSRVGVCFASTREAASETVRTSWPLPAIPGELSSELPLPRHFEQAAAFMSFAVRSMMPQLRAA